MYLVPLLPRQVKVYCILIYLVRLGGALALGTYHLDLSTATVRVRIQDEPHEDHIFIQ